MEATVGRVRLLLHDREIGVEARAWRTRVLPDDREIEVEAKAWRARVRPPKSVRLSSLTAKVEAIAWRARVRPDEPEIDVEAMASRAWVVSRDPKIGMRARVGPMRVVPSEPASGGPVGCAAEPGDGGWGEWGDRRGDAALAGLAEKAPVGAATAGLPTAAMTNPGSRAGEHHGSDHRRETTTCAAALGDLTRNGGVGRGVSENRHQIR